MREASIMRRLHRSTSGPRTGERWTAFSGFSPWHNDILFFFCTQGEGRRIAPKYLLSQDATPVCQSHAGRQQVGSYSEPQWRPPNNLSDFLTPKCNLFIGRIENTWFNICCLISSIGCDPGIRRPYKPIAVPETGTMPFVCCWTTWTILRKLFALSGRRRVSKEQRWWPGRMMEYRWVKATSSKYFNLSWNPSNMV